MSAKASAKTNEQTLARKRATASARKSRQLAKSPLAEAVFELRWEPAAGADFLISQDPPTQFLLKVFSERVAKLGYSFPQEMVSPPTIPGPYAIERRFYSGENFRFPLMQIGPGIFATNQSSEYEWGAFKKQVKAGIEVLFASYPKWPGYSIKPSHLELRYVNALDYDNAAKDNFLDFVRSKTNVMLELTEQLQQIISGSAPLDGRIVLTQAVAAPRKSALQVDIASARRRDGGRTIKIENKVVATFDSIPRLKTAKDFGGFVGNWLEDAHDILSPLFTTLLKEETLAEFRGPL